MLSNLYGDVKNGRVAGPFLLTPHTKQVKVVHNGKVRYVNPLLFAKRHCTVKEKKKMTFGRQVTDLTGNGLNEQYT